MRLDKAIREEKRYQITDIDTLRSASGERCIYHYLISIS